MHLGMPAEWVMTKGGHSCRRGPLNFYGNVRLWKGWIKGSNNQHGEWSQNTRKQAMSLCVQKNGSVWVHLSVVVVFVCLFFPLCLWCHRDATHQLCTDIINLKYVCKGQSRITLLSNTEMSIAQYMVFLCICSHLFNGTLELQSYHVIQDGGVSPSPFLP